MIGILFGLNLILFISVVYLWRVVDELEAILLKQIYIVHQKVDKLEQDKEDVELEVLWNIEKQLQKQMEEDDGC